MSAPRRYTGSGGTDPVILDVRAPERVSGFCKRRSVVPVGSPGIAVLAVTVCSSVDSVDVIPDRRREREARATGETQRSAVTRDSESAC